MKRTKTIEEVVNNGLHFEIIVLNEENDGKELGFIGNAKALKVRQGFFLLKAFELRDEELDDEEFQGEKNRELKVRLEKVIGEEGIHFDWFEE